MKTEKLAQLSLAAAFLMAGCAEAINPTSTPSATPNEHVYGPLPKPLETPTIRQSDFVDFHGTLDDFFILYGAGSHSSTRVETRYYNLDPNIMLSETELDHAMEFFQNLYLTNPTIQILIDDQPTTLYVHPPVFSETYCLSLPTHFLVLGGQNQQSGAPTSSMIVQMTPW